MRVLYGIQGTGNGHITRSMQLIEVLRGNHGVEVDVLISGNQNGMSHLLEPKYNMKGFSITYDKKGRVSFTKTLLGSDFIGFMEDVRKIPFGQYDFVISDFEPVTSYGARNFGIPCIGISNQNHIKKKTKNPLKRLFLHLFSPTEIDLCLSFFDENDSDTFGPIVDLNLSKNTADGDRVLVYLPYFNIDSLVENLNSLELTKGISGFDVFHPEARGYKKNEGNCTVLAINRTEFVSKLKRCYGVLTNCGFSTVSEAMFLDKKLWCIPLENQFEQGFNYGKLKSKGYFVSKKITQKKMSEWISHTQPKGSVTKNSVYSIADRIIDFGNHRKLNRVG